MGGKMTYKEAYEQCKTIKELKNMVRHDLTYARMINPDRIPVITKACEEVANTKFNKDKA